MDAFEQLVAEILWEEGFWVQTSVKVNLSKAEKRAIGRFSNPRWELDIVAYSGAGNILRVVECKSYLNSKGVSLGCFTPGSKDARRYKLFNEDVTREVVLNRLVAQFIENGACQPGPEVQLGLACGKIKTDADRAAMRTLFEERGWYLFDEPWLRERLLRMAAGGYENQVSAVVAKLMQRGQAT